MTPHSSNFLHLASLSQDLARLGVQAERYFAEDPNTCLLKLRQYAELMAQLTAAKAGVYQPEEDNQSALLGRLKSSGFLPRETADLFHLIRKIGNQANHQFTGDHRTALDALKVANQLGFWFQRTFADAGYRGGTFVPPQSPVDESAELKKELAALQEQLQQAMLTLQREAEKSLTSAQQTEQASQESKLWEELAQESSASVAELKEQLARIQAGSINKSPAEISSVQKLAQKAAALITLDEAATRELIDQQLRDAGWEADSKLLDYRKGARPEPGKDKAIAEWPCYNPETNKNTRADYVLFVGLRPVATIEAKRYGNDIADDLRQAEEYSRDIQLSETVSGLQELSSYLEQYTAGEGTGYSYRIPFAYSANGRPFLRQIQTKSGIWHRDLRKPQNKPGPLMGWHRPEELLSKLEKQEALAQEKLEQEEFDYLDLRPYQIEAIQHVEMAITAGQREILLAMATGTGKTRTVIGLIYRLLACGLFNRILFLVDRNSLGVQTQDAFKEYRLEGDQLFHQIYGIKELEDAEPDTKTRVHVATVQSMVRRVLDADQQVPIQRYDCIIVDEAHRGYLLDREMTDGELLLRDQDEYVSAYRRILDYFDAVKIGLTATPAHHTVEIFGKPVFTYTYKEAVVDGYLVDHEPPYMLETELAKKGIHFDKGNMVEVVDTAGEVSTEMLEDELHFDVDSFNLRVLNEDFNKVICDVLARDYLDPNGREKTLIFCVNNQHAELVVDLLKKSLDKYHGEQEDQAVMKITGSIRDPQAAIRQFKTQRLPNIVATVDLLTTGIDVPEICNLVFLRRVRSRILYEQMKGRATRLCDDIEKDVFRIFDVVRLHEALAPVDTMKPVSKDVSIDMETLLAELDDERSYEQPEVEPGVQQQTHADQVQAQLLARLQRLARAVDRRKDDEDIRRQVELLDTLLKEQGNLDFAGLIPHLKEHGPKRTAQLFSNAHGLAGLLSGLAQLLRLRGKLVISTEPDGFVGVTRGYGKDKDGNLITKPEDYLQAFNEFINQNLNQVAALKVCATRPRDLTRADLRELELWLVENHFGTQSIREAWHEAKNENVAASVIGFVRKAVLPEEPLLPFSERVDLALKKILATRRWTPNQEKWLSRLAEQLKREFLLDDSLFEAPAFKRAGGKKTIDTQLSGELDNVIDLFDQHIWPRRA